MSVLLEGPKYETVTVRGAQVQVRLNAPLRVYADASSDNPDRILEALRSIVGEHEFATADGPATVDDFDRDLVAEIVAAWAEVLKAVPLPSSPRSRSRTSRASG